MLDREKTWHDHVQIDRCFRPLVLRQIIGLMLLLLSLLIIPISFNGELDIGSRLKSYYLNLLFQLGKGL
jgi:hypothetical protein